MKEKERNRAIVQNGRVALGESNVDMSRRLWNDGLNELASIPEGSPPRSAERFAAVERFTELTDRAFALNPDHGQPAGEHATLPPKDWETRPDWKPTLTPKEWNAEAIEPVRYRTLEQRSRDRGRDR